MTYELEEVRGLLEYYRDLRPHNHEEIQNRLIDLRKAMWKMPDELRNTLWYRGVVGHTLEQTAVLCDISPSTASYRYSNALIWLTSVMNEETLHE